MARPRKPTALLEAKGAFKKDPQRKRDGEPQVKTPLGNPPAHMTELECAMWFEIAATAPTGVLTSADAFAVEQLSVLLAEFRTIKSELSAQKLARISYYLGQFGMSPGERSKLSIEKPKDVNPFAELE